ncbi:hypothetical protein SLEP1_g34519 [Rubroshorea leprosula]|uniref:Uncharacterized protein n=1 Tax=Rubroshorea leprosula TaxID=152421 RepID=A0AAV5KKI7_9ROSI|nr:hypothetical protein SLEP1_g34519 [Rubroshorea leprosula]
MAILMDLYKFLYTLGLAKLWILKVKFYFKILILVMDC